MLEAILITLLHFSILSYVIWRHPFFQLRGIPNHWSLVGFWIKILGGSSLTAIYTFYYTDRSTADIYKYFDDAKVIYHSVYTNPIDFLKMMSGIGNDSDYFNQNYYNRMNHWYRQYSAYYNDNHTIIRWNVLIMFLSKGHFMPHTLYMSFVSTIGLIATYRAFETMEPNKNYFILLFITPSLAFWGSGVLKEGLVIFGIGGLFWSLRAWLNQGRTTYFTLVFTCSIFILALTKYYLLAILLPGVIASFMCMQFRWFKPAYLFIALYFVALLFFFFLGKISPALDPAANLAHKQSDFIKLAKGGMYIQISDNQGIDTLFVSSQEYGRIIQQKDKVQIKQVFQVQRYSQKKLSKPFKNPYLNSDIQGRVLLDNGVTRSKIEIPELKPDWQSYFKAIPDAYFNVFLQPISPGKNPLYWMAFLENMFVLLCIGYSLFKFQLFKGLFQSPIQLLALFFVLGSLLLIGLTTPVIGALVRYKIPALPLLFGLTIRTKGLECKLE